MIIFGMRKIPDFSLTTVQLRMIACACLAVLVTAMLLSMGRISFRSANWPVYPEKISAADEKIDPNTADEPSLRRLRGMGETRATAIIYYRLANAGETGTAFKNVDDLTKIKGIGPKMVEDWQPHLVFPER